MTPRPPTEPAAPEVAPAEDVVVIPALESPSAAVRVDQADGEIRITFVGGGPVTFPVVDHLVTVPREIAPRFVAAVHGSELVGGSPSDIQEEQP